ncbi:hypothetical protein ACTHPM_21625 [Paenibacillus sp. SAFN-054]
MKGQVKQASSHSILVGDESMKNKTKAYTLHFVRSEDTVQSDAIIKSLAKQAIQKVLDKHGAVAYNLDEILDKYISGEMRNEHERG